MPAKSLRRALVRQDGRDGGLLLVMQREALTAATSAIEGLGLEIRMWGNGSPAPRARGLGIVDGSLVWLLEFQREYLGLQLTWPISWAQAL